MRGTARLWCRVAARKEAGPAVARDPRSPPVDVARRAACGQRQQVRALCVPVRASRGHGAEEPIGTARGRGPRAAFTLVRVGVSVSGRMFVMALLAAAMLVAVQVCVAGRVMVSVWVAAAGMLVDDDRRACQEHAGRKQHHECQASDALGAAESLARPPRSHRHRGDG